MKEFIGQFHPLFVHLPIGFLIVGFVFFLLRKKLRADITNASILWILALTLMASVASSVSGLLLADGGGYESSLVTKHRNGGLILILLSSMLLWFHYKERHGRLLNLFWYSAVIVLFITGHWGGSLTHGEDFISFSSSVYSKPEITDPQQAKVYDEIIEPIFAEKCWSCHSSKKAKGDLRLDGMEQILKGGKNGKVLNAHDPDNSDLFTRLILDKEDDKHMPPDGKPQLTKDEIILINWWIGSGLESDKKANELEQSANVKFALNSLVATEPSSVFMPETKLNEPENASLKFLNDNGVTVSRISADSPFILASVYNKDLSSKAIAKLKDLSEHIIWFRASNVTVDQSIIEMIASFKNMTDLSLNSCKIDSSIEPLSKLEYLKKINLTSSSITSSDLEPILKNQKLEHLYLFNTGISESEVSKDERIIWGNFEMPILKSDTVEFTRDMIGV